MISWSFAYYLSEWVIRLVLLFQVPRRRRPISSLAWLAVIFFQPWVGLFFYLLIGRNRLPLRRTRQHSLLLAELESIEKRFEGHPHLIQPELGPGSWAAVRLAERLGYMPILGGNSAELMGRTEEVVERLVRDIDEAQEHVHLLFYIFADDGAGRKVGEALMRAAKRGVKCRVLADAVGSWGMFGGLGERMRQAGVEVREALPVGLFRRRMARIDLRNHRKVAVIDGRIGYAGSQNIVDASYGRGDMLWHDLMVRLRGPVVLELQAVFVGDWYFEAEEVLDGEGIFPEPEVAGEVSAQTLPSGPNYPTENYQRMVVAALYAAVERVVITTPYFVPDESFMQAMETAVLRGVEVELILPRKSDMVLVNAASRAYFDDLLEAGVRIFLYDDGLLHAKTMSIDDKIAFIGSGNFDIRSFELNFEVNLLFYGSEVAGQLKALQQEYLSRSVKVTQHRWSTRPMVQKVVQNVAKLLSPLL